VWQALHEELGLQIVTVALDTDPSAAVPWIEKAQPRHPALIDVFHRADELFGMVNVPSGVWIDERGWVVRPPETAYPRGPTFLDTSAVPEVRRLRIEAEKYVAALREWVATGRYALAPEEVLRRSRARSIEEATAAAHFEAGVYWYRTGDRGRAIVHFGEAARLQPDNWTYKRQGWKLGVPGADWLGEVRRIGAENYYPPITF
jgi:hypothetical protein